METGAVGTNTPTETLDPTTLSDRDLLVQALLALDAAESYIDSPTPPEELIQTTVPQESSPAQVTEIDDYALIVRALRSLEEPPVVEPPTAPSPEKKSHFTKRKAIALVGAAALSFLLIHGVSSEDTTDARSGSGQEQETITGEPETINEDDEKSRLLEDRSKQRAKNAETAPPIAETDEKQQKPPKNSKEEPKKEKPRSAKDKPDRKEQAKSHETPAKSYIRPVSYEYEITCPLNGYENISGYHTGVDYGTPENTIVIAPKGGVVVAMGTSGGAGRYLTIRHKDGRLSIFQHLNSYFVNVGEGVEQGAEIARTGSTGTKDPHLHWTLTKPEAVSDGDIPSKDDAGVRDRVENPQNFYD